MCEVGGEGGTVRHHNVITRQSYSHNHARMPEGLLNKVRLVPKWDISGTFKDQYQYILNVLKLIL